MSAQDGFREFMPGPVDPVTGKVEFIDVTTGGFLECGPCMDEDTGIEREHDECLDNMLGIVSRALTAAYNCNAPYAKEGMEALRELKEKFL